MCSRRYDLDSGESGDAHKVAKAYMGHFGKAAKDIMVASDIVGAIDGFCRKAHKSPALRESPLHLTTRFDA